MLKKLRDWRSTLLTIFDLQAGLVHEDHVISFHSIPLNSWIPALALALFCLSTGIFILMVDYKLWYLTLILAIASGLLTLRAKHGMQSDWIKSGGRMSVFAHFQ